MADRFPSIEEFSGGMSIRAQTFFGDDGLRNDVCHLSLFRRLTWVMIGQTEHRGDVGHQLDPTTSSDVDFLVREKAALGDDADLFASADVKQHRSARVQDNDDDDDDDDDDDGDDDDLLGADHSSVKKGDLAGEAMSDFQSSFPAINADNSVRGSGPLSPEEFLIDRLSCWPLPMPSYNEFGRKKKKKKLPSDGDADGFVASRTWRNDHGKQRAVPVSSLGALVQRPQWDRRGGGSGSQVRRPHAHTHTHTHTIYPFS